MHVADVAALSVLNSSGKDCIATFRCELTENQCPCPSGSGVAGWVGAIASQQGFLVGRADWLAVDHERPGALIVVFGLVGRQTGVGQCASQQGVKPWCSFLGDRHAKSAGVDRCGLREMQIGINRCHFPAWASLEREG